MLFFLYNCYDDFDHIKHEVVKDFYREYCNDYESFCNISDEMDSVQSTKHPLEWWKEHGIYLYENNAISCNTIFQKISLKV